MAGIGPINVISNSDPWRARMDSGNCPLDKMTSLCVIIYICDDGDKPYVVNLSRTFQNVTT